MSSKCRYQPFIKTQPVTVLHLCCDAVCLKIWNHQRVVVIEKLGWPPHEWDLIYCIFSHLHWCCHLFMHTIEPAKDNCTKYQLSDSLAEKDQNQPSDTNIVWTPLCIQRTVLYHSSILCIVSIRPLVLTALSILVSLSFSRSNCELIRLRRATN